MVEQARQLLRDKPLARWTSLILLALMMLFAYMFVDVLSPMKGALLDDLGWNSTSFGIYGGSEFFLNVFVAFLIFAGIILDRMGIRFTVILSGGLMVVGALIKFYALTESYQGTAFYSWMGSWWTDFPASAKLASVGFMIFGTGCEMAGITVSKAIVKWFKGKELAMAMGLEMAIARLGVAMAVGLSPLVYKWNFLHSAPISRPVLFALFLLVVGFICFIVYCYRDLELDRQLGSSGIEPDDPFRFSDLGKLVSSLPFWVIALLCVTYYSAIFPFQKYAIDMLVNKLSMTPSTAGMIFFWFPIGAAVITPFLGHYMDNHGNGVTMLLLGAFLLFLTHVTFAYLPGGTVGIVIALVAIVVLGISFSLVPAALWPSVPKIIPNSYLGSAYAFIFWIQNWGLMGFPIGIGRVLDKTNLSVAQIEAYNAAHPTAHYVMNYTPAMLCFASLGVVAFVLGLILYGLDRRHKYGLQLPAKESVPKVPLASDDFAK